MYQSNIVALGFFEALGIAQFEHLYISIDGLSTPCEQTAMVFDYVDNESTASFNFAAIAVKSGQILLTRSYVHTSCGMGVIHELWYWA